jgi:peptidoglycan/xylan/chitin deacetylase (PgdA/CDA1 family)
MSQAKITFFSVVIVMSLSKLVASPAPTRLLPIPDHMVVLNFDDGTKTDITTVAPLLKRYGFRATFYVNDADAKTAISEITAKGGGPLSWEEIKQLNEQGFEIGNHTAHHPDVRTLTDSQFSSELEGVERGLEQHGIPAPKTFAYPGWQFKLANAEVLLKKGYLFARRGVSPEFPDPGDGSRGPIFDPTRDNPLLIPTTGYAGPKWGLKDLAWAIDQATNGKIAVIVFHGVPYPGAPWVTTEPQMFTKYMDYLRTRNCKVIATRDLADYVEPATSSRIPLREPRAQ